MLNHLSNSNGTLSMESISEIIDHQTLSRQLVEDTSDLMVQHTLVGRTPSPASSVTVISTHDGVIDEHEVATTSSVILNSDSGEHSNMAMVHSIIDHHSPTYQAQRLHQQHQSNQQEHHHIQHHHHNHQQQHHLSLPQRLQLESPVHFVAGDNTLEALSVGSNCSNTIGHIIAVEQEHKLVIVNGNSNGSSSNSNNNNNNNHKNGITSNNNNDISRNHNKNNCDLGVVLDDLTGDGHTTLDSSDQPNYETQDDCGESETQQTTSVHHMQHQQNHHRHSQQQHHQQRCRTNTHNNSPLQSVQTEPLTVIVQNHEDSRDSATQILSPPELSVVGVGENSLGTSSYQTLTSVVNDEPLSPSGFSPSSAYATLTPLQPLPPISTMSEKFAYGGHISGGSVISASNNNDTTSDDGANGNSTNGSSGVVGPYGVMPSSHHSHNQHQNSQHSHTHQHHSNPLSTLGLSGLSGGEPSPYSSYDKLPSMGMSMTPPHNYDSSPSHTLSGLVVSCDLPTTSPGGCGPLSPQSSYSHSTDLQSPKPSQSNLLHCKDSSSNTKSDVITSNSNAGATRSTSQRHVVCLSSVDISDTSIVGENVIVTDYETSYSSQQRDLVVSTTPSTASATDIGVRNGSHLQLQPPSPGALSPHSVSTSSLNSPSTVVTLPHMTNNKGLVDISALQSSRQQQQHVVSLTPSPPPQGGCLTDAPQTLLVGGNHGHDDATSLNGRRLMIDGNLDTQLLIQTTQQQHHQDSKAHPITSECSNTSSQQTQILIQSQQHQSQNEISSRNKHKMVASSNSNSTTSSSCGDMEEINTKELAQRISAELKRYSIPQAIFAQRVLCRSQGTLSDLLRNPKPWSKLKSGRETFRRMFKWLQEPEFQRMSALRMAAAQLPQRSSCTNSGNSLVNHHVVNNSSSHEDFDLDFAGSTSMSGASAVNIPTGTVVTTAVSCHRKDEPQMEHMPQPKKPRLVFTDLQRRTLQAIFKETKRPSKEMQVTIARQLGLEPTTVGNFFMNARRRSMDKWRDDEGNTNMNSHNNSKCSSYQSSTSSNNQNNHNLQIHSAHHQSNSQNSSQFMNSNNNRNSIGNVQLHLTSSHHHPHHHHSSSLDMEDDGDMDLDLVHDDFELSDNNIDDDNQHHKDDML